MKQITATKLSKISLDHIKRDLIKGDIEITIDKEILGTLVPKARKPKKMESMAFVVFKRHYKKGLKGKFLRITTGKNQLDTETVFYFKSS